jgi:DNA helicase-2/ATP-dependent DNA helicase PcrA
MTVSGTGNFGSPGADPEALLELLNPPQREAVLAVDGPVLILAGAGSGKTRTITQKIAYLVQHCGLAPWEILAVTFTNKAAQEMRERCQHLLGDRAGDLWLGTFHSIGLRILRRHAELIGRYSGFVIYDSDDQLAMIKRCMKELNVSEKNLRPRLVQHYINEAKRQCQGPESDELQQETLQDRQCFRLYALYEDRMKESRACDFTDLLLLPLRILEAVPMVAREYRHRWRYILVDEFQDTNAVQFKLLQTVLNDSKRICVVGDDDQSIYRWRGADVSNILEFADLFPGTTVVKLEQNYRSSGNILKVASHIIASNTGRHEKTLWTDKEMGEKVRLHVTYDERDEAAWIAQKVRTLKTSYDCREMAVFYRTNAQSRPLEDALRRERVPYKVVGGQRFYERMEVKDALAYLKVVHNPRDSVSLERIINVPTRGIGKTTVERIRTYASSRSISAWEATCELANNGKNATRKKLMPFVELIQGLMDCAENEPALAVATAVLDRSGYLAHLEADETPGSETRVENLRELLHAVEDVATDTEKEDLGTFLEQITLEAHIDVADMKSNQVTLMTAHSAKGLEFDVVFVSGLEEGLMPHFNSMDTQEAVEEERRLFYVAATRARKLLYLTHATERRRFGMTHRCDPSRFLNDLPKDAIQTSGEGFFDPPKKSFTSSAKTKQPSNDWSEFSQAMPSYEDESQDNETIGPGSRVFHPKFGTGSVLRINGNGENATIEVRFAGGVSKKIIARFLTRQ